MLEKLADMFIIIILSIIISIVCYPNLLLAMVSSFFMSLGFGVYVIMRGLNDRKK